MYCVTVTKEKRPHFVNIGDDVIADETITPKYGDLVIQHERQNGDRFQICFYTEEVEQTNDTVHVVTRITQHIKSNDEARQEKLKSINWSNTINSDGIDEINDDLKGLSVLIDGLLFADSANGGYMDYQKHSYTVLNKILFSVITRLSKANEKVDYMQDLIRS